MGCPPLPVRPGQKIFKRKGAKNAKIKFIISLQSIGFSASLKVASSKGKIRSGKYAYFSSGTF
jgi:hypothetical protein